MNYFRVLSIAGNDNSGGAGMQADIKTISACGCYAMTAITAVPVQNTLGVTNIFPLPAQIVGEQIDSCISDIGVDAVKIGMLSDSEIIRIIAEKLQKYQVKNIILDPVMVSTSGHRLIEEKAIHTLKTELLYSARIITPNIPEAEILLGKKIKSQSDFTTFAKELSKGKVSVLLKAGHLENKTLTDVFYNVETNEFLELSAEKIDTVNTHGTGCTLSSAVASFIAQGKSLNESVRLAHHYLNQAILSGSKYNIGHGHGPVNHFWMNNQ